MARTEYYLVDHSGRSVRTADDEDGQMIAWISEDLRPKLVESRFESEKPKGDRLN